MRDVVIASDRAFRAPMDAVVIDLSRRSLRIGNRAALFQGQAIFRFVTAIAVARGIALYDDLLEAMWGDDPDGGPNNARNVLFVYRLHAAPRLAAIGLSIERRWGRGFELCRRPSHPVAKATEYNAATSATTCAGGPGVASRPNAGGGSGIVAGESVAFAPPRKVSPEGASEKVGGFPVPAAPYLAERTGGLDRAENMIPAPSGESVVFAPPPPVSLSELSAGGSPGRKGAASCGGSRSVPLDAAPVAFAALPFLGVSSLDWGLSCLAGAAAPFSAAAPNPPSGT